jgi:hypothetical protein
MSENYIVHTVIQYIHTIVILFYYGKPLVKKTAVWRNPYKTTSYRYERFDGKKQ